MLMSFADGEALQRILWRMIFPEVIVWTIG